MKNLRVIPPKTYEPPTCEEIRAAAKSANIRTISASFAADLAAWFAGGKMRELPEVEALLRDHLRETLKPDSDGDYRLHPKGYTKSLSKAVDSRVKIELPYQQNVMKFINSLEKAPGKSPLEQSINVIAALSAQEGGEPGDGDGDVLPVFTKRDGENVADDVINFFDDMQRLEKDEVTSELLAEMPAKRRKAGKVAEVEIDRIARKLDQLSKFKLTKSNKFTPDRNGKFVNRRHLKKWGEISKVDKRLFCLPETYRKYKLITKRATVKERVEFEHNKQLVAVLVDCSGSMDKENRIELALGVMLNRFKAVAKGDAEIYFAFFDGRVYKILHAATKNEAKELMQFAAGNNFSGGSTNIQGAIEKMVAHIAENDDRKPDIAVVTDGEDAVNAEKITALCREKGVKMHAFIVHETNKNLCDAANATGGVAIDNMKGI